MHEFTKCIYKHTVIWVRNQNQPIPLISTLFVKAAAGPVSLVPAWNPYCGVRDYIHQSCWWKLCHGLGKGHLNDMGHPSSAESGWAGSAVFALKKKKKKNHGSGLNLPGSFGYNFWPRWNKPRKDFKLHLCTQWFIIVYILRLSVIFSLIGITAKT